MTKSDCIQCGGAPCYRFRALEIHTLHIRELKGEKRVQALGDSVSFSVCADCAQKQLQNNLKGVKAKAVLPYAAILLFGVILSIVFWKGESVFRLCGAAGAICGILGIISVIKESRQRREQYLALPEEKALEKAAWDVAVRCAEHKRGDHDLTYLPITPDTLKLKNGDLMVAYDLLPEIAVQARNALRSMPQSESSSC